MHRVTGHRLQRTFHPADLWIIVTITPGRARRADQGARALTAAPYFLRSFSAASPAALAVSRIDSTAAFCISSA